jgi:hypothetical protein
MQATIVLVLVSVLTASASATTGTLVATISDTAWRRRHGHAPGELQRHELWGALGFLCVLHLFALPPLLMQGSNALLVLVVGAMIGASVASAFAMALTRSFGRVQVPGPATSPAPQPMAPAPMLASQDLGGAVRRRVDPSLERLRKVVERCDANRDQVEIALKEGEERLTQVDMDWHVVELQRDSLLSDLELVEGAGARRLKAKLQRIVEEIEMLSTTFRGAHENWLVRRDALRLADVRLLVARLVRREAEARAEARRDDMQRELEQLLRLAAYVEAKDEPTRRGLARVAGAHLARHHRSGRSASVHRAWQVRRSGTLAQRTAVLSPRGKLWRQIGVAIRSVTESLQALLEHNTREHEAQLEASVRGLSSVLLRDDLAWSGDTVCRDARPAQVSQAVASRQGTWASSRPAPQRLISKEQNVAALRALAEASMRELEEERRRDADAQSIDARHDVPQVRNQNVLNDVDSPLRPPGTAVETPLRGRDRHKV